MKALSIKQPYAELILSGRKTIEIRKWNTKFRGEFLIHASKNSDKKSMKKFGFDNLPLGAIVGKARLIDVKKYIDSKEFKNNYNEHLATEDFGNYGFLLDNVKKLEIKECKGFLGFWNYEDSRG